MALKDMTKDIKMSTALMQELQISYVQKGVSVLDVYSTEWGPCKAITDTFKRLYTESGDAVHLRFFTVDCKAVLESLRNPDESSRQFLHKLKQTNPEAKDILPEAWQPIFEERVSKSKPFFLFFKEGKRVNSVEGVNTPALRALIKDLCTVKTPAAEYVTNPRLQEFWDENFNPDESEILFDKFVKAVMTANKYTVALNEEEKNALLDAIGVKREAKEKMVTAEGLQKWIGDDENRTVPQAFTETLPDYEDRAAQVRAEREAEDKRRRDEEEKRKQEEEKAEEDRRQKEEEEKAHAEAEAAKAQEPEEIARAADVEIKELVESVPEISTEDDVDEGDEQKAIRDAAAVPQSADQAARAIPIRFVAEPDAATLLATAKDAPALSEELIAVAGTKFLNVHAARAALVAKHEGLQVSGNAILALTLLFCDGAAVKQLLGAANDCDMFDLLSAGTVFDTFKGVGSTAVFTSATANQSELYFCGKDSDVTNLEALEEGATVVLPPLSVLSTRAIPQEGGVVLKFVGIPTIIDASNFTPSAEEKYALTSWFTQFKVASKAGTAYELQYDSLLTEDDFHSASATYGQKARDDEEKLSKVARIQQKKVERAEAQAKIKEKPKTPEKPAEEEKKPEGEENVAEEEKPAEEEKKPEEEKKEAEEEKPAEEQPAEDGN